MQRPNDLISQAEYGRRKGVTRQRINTLVKEGVINLVEGHVDPIAADAAIEKAGDPCRAKKIKPTRGDFYAARAAKEVALAELREMEVKEKKGDLVNAEELKYLLVSLFVNIKTQLRSIPNKVAPKITDLKLSKGKHGTADIQKILLREIDEVLKELSHWRLPEKEVKK